MNLEHIYRDLLMKREEREEYEGTIRGVCEEYCPYFEYIERTIRNDVSKYEKDILIKKYNRSSAGKTKAFPEDVRPVNVLAGTLDYIFKFCYNDFSLDLYKFLENRTRAIRLDIAIQELDCDITISILEKICRFHILYNYALFDNKQFESHLNLDQCKKILGTLYDLYTKRNYGARSTNEIEFICYYILISFDDKFLFLDKYTNYKKIVQSFNIRNTYSQNNIYNFFNLSRKSDFLSYCILHSYFDKIRLRGIEIYSKCFVEKIDNTFIKKMLYVTDKELTSLCKKINISIEDGKVDFKNKNLFENDSLLIKERKEYIGMSNPSLLIYTGDADYKISEYLQRAWVKNFVSQIYLNTTNINSLQAITRTKTQFNIFTSQKETENDIFDVIKKIYCRLTAKNFVIDIRNRVNIFEKKKTLAKKICFYILDLYIKNYIQNISVKNFKISKDTTKLLAIVTDESIFSAIFMTNVKKSNLMNLNPEFLKYKEVNANVLLKYRVSVFSVNKQFFIDIENKYFMLNKILDTPQNLTKRLDEIRIKVEKSAKIIKNKINILLENKSRIKQIGILSYLIGNKRNPECKEEWIEKIDKKQRLDNVDVYYEENAKFW
jgi:hypothetical protein